MLPRVSNGPNHLGCFAQRVAAARKLAHPLRAADGDGTVVEVYAGMWHDFIQESEGCGTGHPLLEAIDALGRAANFLSLKGGSNATRSGGAGTQLLFSGEPAPIRWHFDYNMKPPVATTACQAVW